MAFRPGYSVEHVVAEIECDGWQVVEVKETNSVKIVSTPHAAPCGSARGVRTGEIEQRIGSSTVRRRAR